MAASSRYRRLGRSLTQLRRDYLGFAPRLAGNYTRRQLSLAAAYTVFAHGEFEDFIEEWATDILNKFDNRGHGYGASPMLVHLHLYRSAVAMPAQIPTANNWQTTFSAAIASHRAVINNNHGIREAHICRLLIPLGFDVAGIDVVLRGDLDAFASIRGNHAHHSTLAHLGQQFDPFDRLAKVNNI